MSNPMGLIFACRPDDREAADDWEAEQVAIGIYESYRRIYADHGHQPAAYPINDTENPEHVIKWLRTLLPNLGIDHNPPMAKITPTQP